MRRGPDGEHAKTAQRRDGSLGRCGVFFPIRPCYTVSMTKLLDDALRAVRNLSPDEQDNIARAVLRLTGCDDEPPVALSVDERAAIEASKSAAARGEFASDEQVRAAWAKHGL